MTNKQEAFIAAAVQQQQEGMARLDRLLEAARPEAVFGKPMAVGDSQVFTASETLTTLGFGFGAGGGEECENPAQDQQAEGGSGGGGGGGGMSTGRPVAIVRVDAEGVTVEPVVDLTKIALAAFTALGAMFVMFAKMAKRAQ
jgi:uncharacterized spore protein YtfJ